jgi:hypothetical protein
VAPITKHWPLGEENPDRPGVPQTRIILDVGRPTRGASDLLATSAYYQGNILLPGKPPRPSGPAACAAAATDSAGKPAEDTQRPPTLTVLFATFATAHH